MKTTIKKLPDLETLNQLLRLEDGHLFWRERGIIWFSHCMWPERQMKMYNSHYADRAADTHIATNGYRATRIMGIDYLTHRVIYKMAFGIDPNHIDHMDGNPLNNLPENLRSCTHSENLQNQKMHDDNTSGFLGVTWHKSSNKWMAYGKVHGKQRHLGLFEDKRKAATTAQDFRNSNGYSARHGVSK